MSSSNFRRAVLKDLAPLAPSVYAISLFSPHLVLPASFNPFVLYPGSADSCLALLYIRVATASLLNWAKFDLSGRVSSVGFGCGSEDCGSMCCSVVVSAHREVVADRLLSASNAVCTGQSSPSSAENRTVFFSLRQTLGSGCRPLALDPG